MSDEEFGLARRRAGGFVVIAEHIDAKTERKVMAFGAAWLVSERVHDAGAVRPRRRSL